MRVRTIAVIGLIVVVAAVAVAVVIAALLTPQASNPAFTTAVAFVQAAGQGVDSAALTLLDDAMHAYVAARCADGSPSACIQSYTLPEWGSLVSAIFRRAAPDGQNWDVEVIAIYQHGEGASGVCSLIHVAPEPNGWRVAGWAGFVHCGAADLASANRAP